MSASQTVVDLNPPPFNAHAALPQVTKCLENTLRDVDVELRAFRTVIHNGYLNTAPTTLQEDLSSADWVVVRIAVDVGAVVEDLGDGADVVVFIVPSATGSKASVVPGHFGVEVLGAWFVGVLIGPPSGLVWQILVEGQSEVQADRGKRHGRCEKEWVILFCEILLPESGY